MSAQLTKLVTLLTGDQLIRHKTLKADNNDTNLTIKHTDLAKNYMYRPTDFTVNLVNKV